MASYALPPALSALGDVVAPEVAGAVAAWSLTAYDRVVFLGPETLALRNPDALFACEGLCLRREPPAPPPHPPPGGMRVASRDSTGGAGRAGGAGSAGGGNAGDGARFSTSVMVLEPSAAVFQRLRDELAVLTPSPRTAPLPLSLSLEH